MSTMTEDDNTPEEEYVATETPPEPEAAEPEPEEQLAEAPEEVEETEEEDDGDARLEASDDDDEDDAPQAGKRQLTPEEKRAQRQNRKYRRRAAIEHKERELAFLRAQNQEFQKRIQEIEQRTQKYDVNLVDQRLNETVNEIQTIDRIIAKAVEQGQGEDVAKAIALRQERVAMLEQLKAAKTQAEAPKPEPEVKKPDPIVALYAKEWMKQNDWYDASGRDEDSAIVQAIDKSLSAEGMDPSSEEYWTELDRRVAKRLPHRYDEDTEVVEKAKPKAAPAKKGPPVGGKREHASASTRREVYVSPERKQAMMDAGYWEDPELRKRMLKRYAEADRNNSSR